MEQRPILTEIIKGMAPIKENRTMKHGRNSVPPGVYRHFKGNIYHVPGVSVNTETGELTVICIPQGGQHVGELCNRNIDMFLEHIEGHEAMPNYKGPRFTLLEERRIFLLYDTRGESVLPCPMSVPRKGI